MSERILPALRRRHTHRALTVVALLAAACGQRSLPADPTDGPVVPGQGAGAGRPDPVGSPGVLGGNGGQRGGAGGERGGVGGAPGIPVDSLMPQSPRVDARVPPDAYVPEPCGQPGQPCCPVGRCEAGGCCFAGRCLAPGDACSADGQPFGRCTGGSCACGGADQVCCPVGPAGVGRPACDTGLACDRRMSPETCRRCGATGGRCCPDSTCTGEGAICASLISGADTQCAPCGRAGGPCCEGNTCGDGSCCVSNAGQSPMCVAQGAACPLQGGSCRAGSCGDCGGLGQPCCGQGRRACAASGSACLLDPSTGRESCRACGGPAQPCCGSPTSPAACQRGLRCQRSQGDESPDGGAPVVVCRP